MAVPSFYKDQELSLIENVLVLVDDLKSPSDVFQGASNTKSCLFCSVVVAVGKGRSERSLLYIFPPILDSLWFFRVQTIITDKSEVIRYHSVLGWSGL